MLFLRPKTRRPQRFGWEAAMKLGGNSFDWRGGFLEEQPAKTVRDFIKQRQTWFVGNLQNRQGAGISRGEKKRRCFAGFHGGPASRRAS